MMQPLPYTPGPWIIGYAGFDKPYVIADHGKRWDDPIVCHLYQNVTPEDSVTSSDWLEAFDNAEANAKLIVAAPNMIMLLHKYLELLGSNVEPNDKEALTKLLNATRDIIEEVEGT